MPYNFAADNFHRKTLCSRLSSSEVQFLTENGRFAFLSPFRDLGQRTIIIVGSLESAEFLLVLIFSLYVTAEALRAKIDRKLAVSLQRGPVDSNFQVEGVALTNQSFS